MAAARKSTHYVALGPESVGRGADPASADPASNDRMEPDVRVEAVPCPGVCDLERPEGSSIWALRPSAGARRDSSRRIQGPPHPYRYP